VVLPIFEVHDPNVPVDGYDPEAAKSALEAAGYVAGEDGIRAKDGQRLSFRCLAQAGRADDETAQQVLIAMLKNVGIEMTPDNKTGVAFREARYGGDYDLYYGRWITSADPVYSVFFSTEGANNGQGYSNPALDEVLAKLENTLVPEERKALASQMQQILYDDLPTIPLTTNVSIIAKTTKLKNFKPNPTNMTNFVDTAEWYLEG
jgi:peptide/nickel transport system substrate-binding protein